MMLVFENPNITISAQCCCGTLQGHHTIIKVQCLDMLIGGALMCENTHSHMVCTVHNADSMCLKTLDTPQYSLDLSQFDLLVFSPFKAQNVRQNCQSDSSAVVSASIQGALCGGRSSAGGMLVQCLPQHIWGQFLTTSILNRFHLNKTYVRSQQLNKYTVTKYDAGNGNNFCWSKCFLEWQLFLYSICGRWMKHDYEELVEWYWWRQTKAFIEESVPVPLCLPQISHILPWDRMWVSKVRGQWLTAWVMAQADFVLKFQCDLCVFGIEDSQGNLIVDQRQVLKIWENYITDLYDRVKWQKIQKSNLKRK
jgi:hypothetical protein